MDRDRNLLFGVLAVQLRKVTPTQLVDIAGAWAMDPSRCLGDRLLEAKIVSPEDKVLLDGLVDQAIKTFDGDASLALESFGGEEEVYHSFRGSVAMTDSGGIKSVAVTKRDEAEVAEAEELGDIPAVEEMPSRYTYVNEYGRGGMGRVLLVHDEVLGRDLALKELLPNLVKDGKDNKLTPVRMAMPLIARFLQEAKITGQLEHPSIVPVYELGHRKDGTLYYTMKLVRGKTLHKAIHECKNLEERLKLLPHFVDLCNAIAYAHKHGVIHRDIKPMNVMIGEFGETVVLDWGLAKIKNKQDIHAAAMQETVKALNLGDDALSGKTRHGDILGTPLYMPPEQAKGDLNAIDERSDIYSLGAVLYEILTGNPPFGEQNVMQTIYQVINETPKSIASQERRCPPDLIQFCNKAMEKLPDRRYQKAKEFADAVEGSKLRPPKSRWKKYLQRAAIFLIVFIPCCTIGLNIKSERDLSNVKAYYEAQGIDVSKQVWGEELDKNRKPPTTDPTGAVYALEWQFPAYWWKAGEVRYIHSKFYRSRNRSNSDNLLWDDEDVAQIRNIIKENNHLLHQIKLIAKMPPVSVSEQVKMLVTRGGYITPESVMRRGGTWETQTVDRLGVECCAGLLFCEAILRIHDDSPENALEPVLDMFRFANHLKYGPSLSSVYLRYFSIYRACFALQVTLNYADLSKNDAELLEGQLEEILPKADMRYGLEMELATFMSIIRMSHTNPEKIAGAIVDRSRASSSYLGNFWGGDSRLVNLALLLYGSWPLRFWLNYDTIKGVDYLSQIILLNENVSSDMVDKADRLYKSIWKNNTAVNHVCYPFASQQLRDLQDASLDVLDIETVIKQSRIALAIKEYQQENLSLPSDLDALVPDYLDSVPVDPFTAQPFIYQYDEDGYTLYGAGMDGKVHLGVLRRTTRGYERSELENALQQYHREYNAWPESLETLVPAYISEVPLDFMTGQPLTFTIKGRQPQIMVQEKDGTMSPLPTNTNITWVGW